MVFPASFSKSSILLYFRESFPFTITALYRDECEDLLVRGRSPIQRRGDIAADKLVPG